MVSKNDLIKILGRGELKAKLAVTAHAFSKTAKAAVEAAGGKATTLVQSKEAGESPKEMKPKAVKAAKVEVKAETTKKSKDASKKDKSDAADSTED